MQKDSSVRPAHAITGFCAVHALVHTSIVRVLAVALMLSLGGRDAFAQNSPQLPNVVLAGSDSQSKVALAVSGGISKGSYQAGVMYGIVRALRDWEVKQSGASANPNSLIAATGASAGNINALLVALDYCRKEMPSIDSSFLAQAWLPVGYQQLLIPRELNATGRRRESFVALFRSDFLRDSVGARILRAMTRPNTFRPGCVVPIGITMTRTAPATHEIGAGIRVPVSRFAVLAELKTHNDGRATLNRVSYLSPEQERSLGAIADLETSCDGTISSAAYLEAMLASSAFPLAFEPVKIRYTDRSTTTGRGSCTRAMSDSARFLDGGVFDNNPLDLLGALVQPRLDTSDIGVLRLQSQLDAAELTLQRRSFEVDSNTTRIRFEREAEESNTLRSVLAELPDTARPTPCDAKPSRLCVTEAVKMFCRARQTDSLAAASVDFARCEKANFKLGVQVKSSVNEATIKEQQRARDEANDRVLTLRAQVDAAKQAVRLKLAQQEGFVTFFVDPDNVRGAHLQDAAALRVTGNEFGVFSDLSRLVFSFLTSARAYELQIAGRSRAEWFLRGLRQTERSARIAGTSLESFGAFLHRGVREHDFAVGAYDGLRSGLEALACRGHSEVPLCVAREIQQVAARLDSTGDQRSPLINWLLDREHVLAIPRSTEVATKPNYFVRIAELFDRAPVGAMQATRCSGLSFLDASLCVSAMDSVLQFVATSGVIPDKSWNTSGKSVRTHVYRLADAVVTQLRFVEEMNDGVKNGGRLGKISAIAAEVALHSQSPFYEDAPSIQGRLLQFAPIPCRSPACGLFSFAPSKLLWGTGGRTELRWEVLTRASRTVAVLGYAGAARQSASSERGVTGAVAGFGLRLFRRSMIGISAIDATVTVERHLESCGEVAQSSGAAALGIDFFGRLLRAELQYAPERWMARCDASAGSIGGGARRPPTVLNLGVADVAGLGNAVWKMLF